MLPKLSTRKLQTFVRKKTYEKITPLVEITFAPRERTAREKLLKISHRISNFCSFAFYVRILCVVSHHHVYYFNHLFVLDTVCLYISLNKLHIRK